LFREHRPEARPFTAIKVDVSRKVVHVDTDVIQRKREFSAMRGRFVTPLVGGFP